MSQASAQSTSATSIYAPGGSATSGNSNALPSLAIIIGAVVVIAIAAVFVWKGRK
jgi:hypothetical protein